MKTIAAALVLAAGVVLAADDKSLLVSREVYLMGTRATLSTFDESRRTGLDRLESLLGSLEATEARLSTWRSESEVSRLNASSGRGPVTLSPSLCETVRVLATWIPETNGAFDPAIGALTAAWDLHGRGRVPTHAELSEALARSGWTRVAFEPSRCTIALPAGVTLDVGAWGKGDALDRARTRTADDPAPWLIDLGGQVAANSAPGGEPWTVAIAHPLHRDAAALRLTLTGGSLATSAGSERDLHVNGRRIGHILDPRTGFPARFTGSVTAWHERALVADILSTALFVMGPDEGMRWADARGIAACYLTAEGRGRARRRTTAAFRNRFAIS